MIEYTNDELQNSVLEIRLDLVKDKQKYKEKKVVILGGQPGSGKTKLARLYSSMGKDYIVISGDDYRKKHPRYYELQKQYGDEAVIKTQKFAGEITESLISLLSDEGYNLIIEGTLRTKEIPLKTQKLLKEKGYYTELSIMATKPDFSYLSTLKRYEEMLEIGMIPRSTPKEHHDLVVSGILQNIEQIYAENKFDNITIYNRKGVKLYSQLETPDKNTKVILEKEFTTSWEDKEERIYFSELQTVISKMELRTDSRVYDIKKMYGEIEEFRKNS